MPATHPRRPISYALSLLALTVAVAACGRSSGTSSAPTASPSPTASPDVSAYEHDSGGLSYSQVLPDAGYSERYPDAALDHLAGAFHIIEHSLPNAVDLNQVIADKPGYAAEGTAIFWEPNGRRDTLLPPGGHGERIYQMDVDLDPYVEGGDAIAHIAFISRAQGDGLDSVDLSATPDPYPNQIYTFKVDRATAAALLDYFWVKAEPAATETGENQGD